MSGRHGKKKMEDEESDGSTEEEEDDSEMEDDEKEIAEEKAYRYYSPLVKSAVGNVAPNLVTDRTIRICEACPTRPRFPGWKALFAHAGTFKKKKRIQHRGLYRALEEALVSEAGKEVGLETRAAQPHTSVSHKVVWPPILIMENVHHDDPVSLLPHVAAANIAQVVRARNNDTTFFLVFKDEPLCYVEARGLAEQLAREGRGKADSFRCRHACGYLAEAVDMETKQPLLDIAWSLENCQEKVKNAVKQEKQKYDQEKALYRGKQLDLEKLKEHHEEVRSSQQLLELRLEQKQKELELLKRRSEEMEQRRIEEFKLQQEKFLTQLRQLDAQSSERERKLHGKLAEEESRMAHHRVTRLHEIGYLRACFEQTTERAQCLAKELLDKEEAALKKQELFEKRLLEEEAKFNEQAREREKALMQEQEKEKMRLLDENENQKQALLEEWLDKQEKLKKDAESKKVAEAANNEECAVCAFNFQEAAAGGRALFACGHVGVCMTCAIDIWERQKKKECPLCRAQIKCRPTKLPEVIYGLQ